MTARRGSTLPGVEQRVRHEEPSDVWESEDSVGRLLDALVGASDAPARGGRISKARRPERSRVPPARAVLRHGRSATRPWIATAGR